MNEKGSTNFEYRKYKAKGKFWTPRNASILIVALCCIVLVTVLLLVSINIRPGLENAVVSSRLDTPTAISLEAKPVFAVKTESVADSAVKTESLDDYAAKTLTKSASASNTLTKPVATNPRDLDKIVSKTVSESESETEPEPEHSDSEAEIEPESKNASAINGKIIGVADNKLYISDEKLKFKVWKIMDNSTELSCIFHPTYSFDGKFIAFLNCIDKIFSLFIMKEDGTDIKLLASNVNLPASIAFTHNDDCILYKNVTDNLLRMINIKSSEKTILTITIIDNLQSTYNYNPQYLCQSSPNFSSDGNFLLCVGFDFKFERGIQVIDAKSGVFLCTLVKLSYSSCCSFSISPDCKYVAYTLGSEIHIINLLLKLENESKANDIIIFSCENKNDLLSYLTWSPDGKGLLYKHYCTSTQKAAVFYTYPLNMEEPFSSKPLKIDTGINDNTISTLSWQVVRNEKI